MKTWRFSSLQDVEYARRTCRVRTNRPSPLISLHIRCLLNAGVCVGVHLPPNELNYQFCGFLGWALPRGLGHLRRLKEF